MRPTAALWFLFADEDTWRLLLALPAMASNPPQVVYNRLIDILNRRVQGEISVDRVGLMPPENHIVSLLSMAIQTGKTLVGIRFTNNTINGELVPDAYIYRLHQPARDIATAG